MRHFLSIRAGYRQGAGTCLDIAETPGQGQEPGGAHEQQGGGVRNRRDAHGVGDTRPRSRDVCIREETEDWVLQQQRQRDLTPRELHGILKAGETNASDCAQHCFDACAPK